MAAFLLVRFSTTERLLPLHPDRADQFVPMCPSRLMTFVLRISKFILPQTNPLDSVLASISTLPLSMFRWQETVAVEPTMLVWAMAGGGRSTSGGEEACREAPLGPRTTLSYR